MADPTPREGRRPIDVGEEIAEVLYGWRPTMDTEDVSAAVVHAVSLYSMKRGCSSEVELRDCLFRLTDHIDEYIRSI